MPIPGPRPRGGGAGGGGGLAAVVHDSSLDGALRETLGEWNATLAATAGAVGYASEVDRSADGSPTTVHGAIAPAPPVLRIGADAWRVAAVRQRADNHAVEIRLGAPNGRKARRARAALAVGPNWADSGAALDATRDTTYTFSVPNAATTGFAEFTVAASALRALDEQTAGQAASPAADARGRDYLLFDANDIGSAVPWRVGRDADSILLSTPVAEAVAVGIDADDGPPAAEAPSPPAGVDWRVGDITLHLEDARATHAPRRVDGGRQTESLRTLTWTGVPAGTLRAGPATVRALGPAVDPAALPPRPTRADAGESLRVSAAGLYELYQPSSGGGVHVGASPPAAPAVGALWMDTADPAEPELKRWAVLASKRVRFARGHAGLVAGEVGANVALALPLDTARTLTWIYFRSDGDVEALVAPFGSRADLAGHQLSVAGRAYGDFSSASLNAGDARNPDLYSFGAGASNPPTDEDVVVSVASWESVDDHELHAGATLPASPRVGHSWVLTATDGANAAGFYVCHSPGAWTFVGPRPQTSQQIAIPRPPRLVSLWGAAATVAGAGDPFNGLASGAYGDDGWVARPTGWHANPADVVVPGGQSRMRATALATWDSAAGRWTFGSALVEIADAYSAQYSTHSDGRAAHAAPTANDVYYRRRDPSTGAWSPWLRVHAPPQSRDWVALVDYSARVGAGGHRWRYSHALAAPIRPADWRELAIAVQIDSPSWQGSDIILPMRLGVANHGDTAYAYRGGITLVADYDADGRRQLTQGDHALPAEDHNVGSGRRWGIRAQFRRGATDPAGVASFFDILESRVTGLTGRYQVLVR